MTSRARDLSHSHTHTAITAHRFESERGEYEAKFVTIKVFRGSALPPSPPALTVTGSEVLTMSARDRSQAVKGRGGRGESAFLRLNKNYDRDRRRRSRAASGGKE